MDRSKWGRRRTTDGQHGTLRKIYEQDVLAAAVH
jgi:hypothetical protein